MKKLLLTVMLFIAGFSFAVAQRNVSGKVTDRKDGSPLSGVSVSVKGTNTAVQTNAQGEFSLSGVADNATLVFSNVSYKTVETKLSGSNTLSIILDESAQQLTEVIVTANAVKREARSVGYAQSTINNAELTKGKDRSVLNSLQGKVAGVQISSSSGGVGSSTRIVFRGGTSITGNNQALIVVDGIPIDNSQTDAGDNLNNQVDAGNRGNDINPDDVESVTLLKGPAAAALYGTRAANGALIITTKTGKSLKGKRSEIIVSSSYNLESILKLPEYQNEYGQGGQGAPDSRENFSWGPQFDGAVRPWGQQIGDSQRVKPYVGLKNNVKEFFDIGRTLTNNVSFAQNNEKSSFFLSYNNVDQKGIMPGTSYKRNSVKLSGTADLSEKFYSSASINYIRSKGDLSVQGQGSSPYDQVLQTPRDISLLELKDYKNKFNDLNGYYGAYTVNPWYILGEDSYTSVMDRILGNAQIGYKPVKWLDISLRVGTDVSSDKRKQIDSKRVIDPNSQNAGNNFAGRYSETTINIREFTSDLIATAKKNITNDLALTVLVGHNIRQRNVDNQFSQINSLTIPFYYNLANSAQPPVTTNFNNLRRLYGVYSDVNLAYKNFLFLGLTGRNDWSSTLPKGKNNFFYPSVNSSFVFSEAFKMPKFISYGKIRASAAQVGNDAAPYLLESVFITGTVTDGQLNSQVNFPLNGTPGFTQGNVIGNPEIRPEITTSYEGGIELGFLNNRITFEGTVYSNKSKDQIITVPIAASSGYTTQTLNAGLITNKGIELLLRGTPVKTRNFSWDITATFTRNRNKVVELFPGTEQLALGGFNGGTMVAQVGQPYGSFFGSSFLRSPDGNIVVDATTGYPVTDPIAKIHGNVQPDFLAGLNNSFSYKGFSLSFLFDAKKGGVFYSRTKALQEFVGTDPRTLYNDRAPFVVPGSVVLGPDGKYTPNTTPVQNAENYWTSFSSPRAMEHLVDASFIKLREASLTYRLPSTLFKKGIKGVMVGISGRNLWLKTPKENTYADPETSSFGTGNVQGYEYGTIPSLRNYGVNVRVSF
ncbi:MAG: SusC/RagA family TonB-linked outer membrane protein [Chitinophagaceae bacterium]|nr:SusC/RagA family TonB-linked outer membrane protein [Chitinophagaceae bacterium]